ncbi:GNAT family N-acetyltransferase [Clostridium sp.]|uniref:GNAT family N-acetyltransferase n=1 Tax=Clostridium sp. TaxID=1506 RepID=UPI003D6D8BD2
MSNIVELVVPSVEYFFSYVEAIKEYEQNNVPSNYFWLIDNSEFIGEVSIRHKLTDELLRRGGHIGYGVRYSIWNKHYLQKM